jgi:hypothetical protein
MISNATQHQPPALKVAKSTLRCSVKRPCGLALFRTSQPSVQLYGSGNQSIKHNGRTREKYAVLLVAARPTDTDTRLRLTVH